MKRTILALSALVLLGAFVATNWDSSTVDAQDTTEDRLAAVETQVAAQATETTGLRKRVKRLEEAVLTPQAETAQESPEQEPDADPTAAAAEAPVATAEPATGGSTYLGGNAQSLLGAGDAGELVVVAAGTYDRANLPIIVRNNTDRDVIRITVSGVARDADGSLLASGGDQGFKPNLVRAGGYALGYLYFDGVDLPGDATFEYDVDARDATDDQFEGVRDLEVASANALDGRIVGELHNGHDETVTGPIGVSVVCFDASGTILGHFNSFTDKEEAAAGETVPFQVDIYDGTPCETFLIAGSGYNF